MVADDLLARLAEIGAAAVFDTDAPPNYTPGANPALVLSQISSVPDTEIDGDITVTRERWQVSVLGAKLHSVRIMAQAVASSLHGYTSESISRCDYEAWPGTTQQSSNPVIYHAPVDFIVLS